jgi:hypothetical protein
MNTFNLRKQFRIPVAARDLAALAPLGLLMRDWRRPDGSIYAVTTKALSAVSRKTYAGGAALIPAGSDISVARYSELVDGEQLWISPTEPAYRAVYAAWHSPPGLPPGFDVDHALSKALAIHLGYDFVRLTLVDKHANRSAGSSGEKLAVREGPPPAALARLPRDPLLYADPSDLAKLFHVSQGGATLGGVGAFQKKNGFIFGGRS